MRGAQMPGARGGDGKLAGLPEGNDLLQAGDQAGEARQDQRVQRRDDPGLGSPVAGIRAQFRHEVGEGLRQGG